MQICHILNCAKGILCDINGMRATSLDGNRKKIETNK